MIFDTFRDRQNGFVFGTNAAGIQYDAQVRDQGDPAASWDGSWEVRTSATTTGWNAEFRIPLRTLRYGPSPQTWGVNFFRNIQRTRERTYWRAGAYLQLGRLRQRRAAGARSADPRNFKLLRTSSARQPELHSGTKTDLDGDIGFDAKFASRPFGTLTQLQPRLRPVEGRHAADQPVAIQPALSRETAVLPGELGLFTIGKDDELDLFFSRRIGLDEDGLLVPIKGGGRLSGKINGLNVGVLNMQTGEAGLTPANNFSALRVSRELPNRSGIGAMFVNRTATGNLAGSRDWNARGERMAGSGSASTSRSPALGRGGDNGPRGRDYAYNVDSNTTPAGIARRSSTDGPARISIRSRLSGKRGRVPSSRSAFRDDAAGVDSRLGVSRVAPHVNYSRYDY